MSTSMGELGIADVSCRENSWRNKQREDCSGNETALLFEENGHSKECKRTTGVWGRLVEYFVYFYEASE